jgi:hypothetical protein
MLRTIWRSSGKRWLALSQQWLERRRFSELFSAMQSPEQAGERINKELRMGTAFCAARMGHVEARIIGEWLLRKGRWSRATLQEAHLNAGIFPVDDDGLEAFALEYWQSLQQVDLLGFWQSDYQAALVASLLQPPVLCPLPALEPFRQSHPWSAALKGKSVLVVHPFSTSIAAQYSTYGSTIFPDCSILPSFHLQVLQPPLTHAPQTEGYEDWGCALAALKSRVLGLSFDVALVGCGAYGLPLAAAIGRAGRQAIHLGGALQLLFGIQGRRWDQDAEIQRLISQRWIRPSPTERPATAASIEGGCYW